MSDIYSTLLLINNSRLVYQQNSSSKTSAASIFVKVGSVNEPQRTRRCKSFKEHMIFKDR